MGDKDILKLTLEEYGYKLSDYISPSNGLEMAILEAIKRCKEEMQNERQKPNTQR